VGKVVRPPGSVNYKGQQKVVDPTTGKTKLVQRRKGGALDFQGNVTSRSLDLQPVRRQSRGDQPDGD
jgi:hypothetical protein